MDSPEMSSQPEQRSEGPCFPVTRKSIDAVNGEIQANYRGDIGSFAKATRTKIKGDPEKHIAPEDEELDVFLKKAADWLRDNDGDAAAFEDGAMFAYRALQEQGKVPLMQKEPSEALRAEEDRYADVARRSDRSLDEVLLSRNGPTLSISDLDIGPDHELGRALKELAGKHPAKPQPLEEGEKTHSSSFVLGGEMLYSVLQKADVENLALEADMEEPDLDRELAELTGGK